MKQLSIFVLVALLFSCKQPIKDRYIIEVNAPGVYNGLRAYLRIPDERSRLRITDTAVVIDEKFTFEGVSNEPTMQYLTIDSYPGNLPVIVENGEIEINIVKDSLHTSKIIGSDLNDDYAEFFKTEQALSKEIRSMLVEQRQANQRGDREETIRLTEAADEKSKQLMQLPLSFINGNEDSYISAITLHKMTLMNRTPVDTIEVAYNKLTDRLKNSSYGAKILNYINVQKEILEREKATQIGAIAPNFTSKTPDGKDLSLKDVMGKVTLIDFWAAWCGPCRRENPNIVKAYEKYHDKGFEIIGVSLDRSGQKDRWLKAIEDDNLTWHQVSNLQYFQGPVARMYNINSIPASFLLDENGKIIARNLRGSALEKELEKLFN